MLKSLRHMAHLTRVAFVLSRHDALMDLLAIFGDQPRAVARFRAFRRPRQAIPAATARSNLVEAFQSLGPSFIKIGQAMATRPDIVGPEMALELMRLQDDVPPFPAEDAIRIIEEELGAPLDQLFRTFDQVPVAAASIAQVHFATTLKGQSVAVKVLRPDIEKAFARDLESFHWLARIMERFSANIRRLKPTSVVDTISETIALEMNLRYEAAAASELRDITAGNPDYAVPDINWDLTARRVLCTGRVHGIPFSRRDEIIAAGYDVKQLAERIVHSFLEQALNHGFFHADLHQGNLFATPGNKITAVDFGIMGRIDQKTRKSLAAILYGFLQRDYDLVARTHFEIGYVPEEQSLEKFKQAIRAISEPVVGKPVSEISIGRLLSQLFETTETFNMQTQPQLILLQKTMITVEGVALNLYPEINMWETSRPIVETWMRDNLGPRARVQDFATTTLETLNRLPRLLDHVETLTDTALKADRAREKGQGGGGLRLFAYGLGGGIVGGLLILTLYHSIN